MKNKISLLLIAALVLVPSAALGDYSRSNAQSYLASHADSPWSTMGLAALSATAPSDYLKSVTGASAIDYAAPILAITSLNQDPRTFGSTDYVAKLKDFYTGGQIGDTSALNDDIFGLLALVSAGESTSSNIVSAVKAYIVSKQNTDGGWGIVVNASSDTNMTGAAIAALIASGASASEPVITKALDYLKTAQNNDGGFTYDPKGAWGTMSDSSSTAWVIWALNAAGIDPASWSKAEGNPISYLESTQEPAGYFEYREGSGESSFSPVNTAYSVIALQRKTLPLNIFRPTVTPPPSGKYPFRIEGKNQTVCTGEANGPKALDIIKNAATTCGFSYEIKDTSFGPYLYRIGDDTAAGLSGWLYLVNNVQPPVGANDYTLKSGESVLWYYGDFDWKPSRLVASSTQLTTPGNVTVTVESFNGQTWSPLSGASLSIGNTLTDTGGQAQVSLTDGTHKIHAQKTGFIRSNTATVTVGSGQNTSASLTVNIDKSANQTDSTISFSVNPAQIDFGTLKPGTQGSRSITITNTGNVGIRVEARVEGDEVFGNNLSIDGQMWRSFYSLIDKSSSKQHQLNLSVPSNYSGTAGSKPGQIIFWATRQ